MSTWLSFYLFGNVSHRKKVQKRISDPQIIYEEAFCDNITSRIHFALTKQLQLRRWRNRKAASACYYLQFPGENWNHGRVEKSGGLKHFTYWYRISFLGSREIIKAFSAEKWFFFDISICILAFLQSVNLNQ